MASAWGVSFGSSPNAWDISWGSSGPVVPKNPRARWTIPNPVVHNAEQAVVQKKIDVKIKSIKRVETKLHDYGYPKDLLAELVVLEAELNRLIDLFELHAQRSIKQEMQTLEEEVIIVSLVL